MENKKIQKLKTIESLRKKVEHLEQIRIELRLNRLNTNSIRKLILRYKNFIYLLSNDEWNY